MNRSAILVMIFSALTATRSIADVDADARKMAQKDYESASAKIQADDLAAMEKCRTGAGAAIEACLIQARGKRMRAEQEAKTNRDRAGQVPSLPKAQAKAAAENAMKSAERNKRSVSRDIDAETKIAEAECSRLTGAARKTCASDVKRRRDDARDLADAMYKKSRSDAKDLKAP